MSVSTSAKEYRLGTLAGLTITATPSAIVGFIVLWIILSVIAYGLVQMPLGNAIVGALAATILHFLSDLWHQFGHAVAARGTGHPMSGVRFGFLGIFNTSLYPPDEGSLPAAVHIRRALGGPLASLVMSIIAAILFAVVSSSRSGGTVWWLALFFLFDNFVVFTLQVFLPLGFNDASTILHWSRARHA